MQQHHITLQRDTHPQPAPSLSSSVHQLRELLGPAGTDTDHPVVARSPQMQQVLEQVRCFARTAATVLLTGESGSGKEVLARLVHQWSERSSRPYVRVNCAALAESLMESELFGHQRGAFTGADQSRAGRLEYAADGTLLLDEISEVPVATQAKLLRALEEEEYQRVGSNTTYQLRARVVATSNRDLQEAVRCGRFRADLFYRLNVLHIHVPPLRERAEDVLPLVELFFERYRSEARFPLAGISPAARDRLQQHSWPGNIRELRNVIRRACIVSRGPLVDAQDLPALETVTDDRVDQLLDMPLDDLQRHVILARLKRYGGNKTKTAETLGITPRTLANKLKRYAPA